MKGKSSVICSPYIIDGIRYNVSPLEMLQAAQGLPQQPEGVELEPVVDETRDASPVSSVFSASKVDKYLSQILADSSKSEMPAGFPEEYTRWVLTKSLIDSLWCCGSFRLEDLSVDVLWQWDDQKIGNLAAFYQSVSALVEYLETLGVTLHRYQYENYRKCRLSVKTLLSENVLTSTGSGAPAADQDPVSDDLEQIGENTSFQAGTCSLWDNTPFRTRKVTKSTRRKCARNVTGSESSWLIYIPFDTCSYKLGGSRLCRVTGQPAVKGPEIGDADYFLDCYEVVREMVEDGIVLSGATIEEGGLMPTLARYIGKSMGISADIGGVMKSYGEKDLVNVLFAEVPGVLLEIADIDYDYVDAEFLLQDIAYYPLGHVSRRLKTIRFTTGDASGITSILQSLLDSQEALEGED